MKQTIKTTRIITMGLFTLCTMGLSNASFAAPPADTPSALTFIGKIRNQPVFELNLNNGEQEEFYINIKDEDLNLLYSEKVKGENLSRKYSLDIDDAALYAPGFGLRVEVTSAKTHKTVVYKISTHTMVTEEFTIAKS